MPTGKTIECVDAPPPNRMAKSFGPPHLGADCCFNLLAFIGWKFFRTMGGLVVPIVKELNFGKTSSVQGDRPVAAVVVRPGKDFCSSPIKFSISKDLYRKRSVLR